MIIDGNKISKKLLIKLKNSISKKKKVVQLDIIYIGDNKESEVYINRKAKIAEEIGVKVIIHKFKKSVSPLILSATCNRLNNDPNCDGYFIQLPIPEKFIRAKILDQIAPNKDVDSLSAVAIGNSIKCPRTAIKTAVVEAIVTILVSKRTSLKHKHAVIVNDSNLIGKPLSAYLLKSGATVTICNKFTKDLPTFTKQADILISATGCPNLIKASMVKKGAVVIDAGFSIKDGKIHGDTELKKIVKTAKWITPVPGGVGPLTITCLFSNLLKLINVKTK